MLLFNKKVGTKELLVFLRNLSVTLKAGIPLVKSIRLMEPHTKKNNFCRQLSANMEKGMTLADAMEFSSWAFPPLVISVVRAGELSGTLQENLHSLALQYQKMLEFSRKIKGAMMYPGFVVGALILMCLSMGLFVLPQLVPFFESLDVKLPITTQFIMWAAKFFEAHGVIFVPSFLLGCFLFYSVLRTKAVKPVRDRLLLRVPLIGPIQTHASLSQFSATMSLLLQSGIPILEAIPSSAQATNNDAYRSALNATVSRVRGGTTFAASLREFPNFFPDMYVELVDIGESAGSLSNTLSYVASFHQDEAEYAVKNFTTALEPMLLIVIGILVGVFIASILIPIYDVTANVV